MNEHEPQPQPCCIAYLNRHHTNALERQRRAGLMASFTAAMDTHAYLYLQALTAAAACTKDPVAAKETAEQWFRDALARVSFGLKDREAAMERQANVGALLEFTRELRLAHGTIQVRRDGTSWELYWKSNKSKDWQPLYAFTDTDCWEFGADPDDVARRLLTAPAGVNLDE